MIEVTATIDVEMSPDEVFAFWSDWSNNPQWQKGQVSCTWTSEPPMQLGSTYDQEASFLGRAIVSSFEVTEFEPGRKVRIQSTESSLPLNITREVTARADGGATLNATIRGEPGGVMRLLNPLMKRMVNRNVQKDYRRLKDLLDQTT